MASIKDSLFGMMAVRAGFVTEEQVLECIEAQQEYGRGAGKVPRLGELLAQKGYMTPDQVQAVLAGQHREKGGLFGEIAIRWKFATREQVEECLEIQRDERAKGNPRKIGEIMLYKGYLQVHQMAAVLEAQKRKTLQCSGCGKNLNAAGFRPGDKLKCAACGSITEVPGVPGFSFADFRPVEVEVTPTDTAQEAQQQAEQQPEVPKEPQKLEIGGYEVLSRLGQDAAGTTLKARHLDTDTVVVLRVMRVTAVQDETFLKRFIDEGKKGTKLIHKYIKRIYEVGLDKGRYYYSTEFVEGKSLKKLLDEERRFTALEAMDLLMKVAQALEYAHNNGVIHGDLRPSYIILTEDGGLKVSEMGIAKDVGANLRYFARSSQVIPLYVAPEVAVDERTTGPASDIYSLGAILYHMIVGSPPYEGANPLEILMRISEEEAPSPHRMGVTTEGLSRVIMKMIAPEPEDRYNSMTEVIEAFREHMRDAALSTSMAQKKVAVKKAQDKVRKRSTGHYSYEELHGRRRGSRPFTWFLLLLLLVAGGLLAWQFALENILFPPHPEDYSVQTPGTEDGGGAELQEDILAYREVRHFVNANPDKPEANYERLDKFLRKYPLSSKADEARVEAARQKKRAGAAAYSTLLKKRDEFVANNNFAAALEAFDAWLGKYSDVPDRTRVIADRKQLLLDENAAIDRVVRKAKWLAGRGDPDALNILQDFKPTRTGRGRIDDAIQEVKSTLAERHPETPEPAPAETARPVPEPVREPKPETPAAPTPANEIREIERAIIPAVARFDSNALREAVGNIDPSGPRGRRLIEEARDLADFIDTIKSRLLALPLKNFKVKYDGTPRLISDVNERSVTLKMNIGGRMADITTPWGQVPAETMQDFFAAVLSNSEGKEHAMAGLYYYYRDEAGYARLALSRALGLGYDKAADIARRIDERSLPETVLVPEDTGAADGKAPSRITFRDEHALSYLNIESGTWQAAGNALRIRGDVCKAVIEGGPFRRIMVRFEFKGPKSRLLLSAGNWRVGLDGINQKFLARNVAGMEQEVSQTVVSDFEYELAIVCNNDGTLYMVNNKILVKDKGTEPQGDQLTITANSTTDIVVKEIRLEQ